MKINTGRLKNRMDEINSIQVTDDGGMMRLALSDADKKARDLLVSWMSDAGMEVKIDDMGSIYGILKGSDPKAGPLCIGSHMDTQPNGGKYDGFYGVMAGLEAVCSIKDAGLIMKSDLVVIDWTNEEGARFVPPMLASGVIAGEFDTQWVYDKVDAEGVRYEDELIRIGYKGQIENRLKTAKAYIEPHIEQGPILDAEGFEFGIVTGALGITGLDVTIIGEANHAGTTPMSHRKDSLIAASEAILKIRENAINFGQPAVVTNGIITSAPGSKNIVPGQVYFSIDLRYHTDDGMTKLEDETKAIIKAVCAEHQVSLKMERYWRAAPVTFNEKITEAIEKVTQNMKIKAKKIISGAGHDAVFISAIVPTGMLFVPSIKGMSHCPQEETKFEDLIKGTEATAEILIELDK